MVHFSIQTVGFDKKKIAKLARKSCSETQISADTLKDLTEVKEKPKKGKKDAPTKEQ